MGTITENEAGELTDGEAEELQAFADEVNREGEEQAEDEAARVERLILSLPEPKAAVRLALFRENERYQNRAVMPSPFTVATFTLSDGRIAVVAKGEGEHAETFVRLGFRPRLVQAIADAHRDAADVESGAAVDASEAASTPAETPTETPAE